MSAPSDGPGEPADHTEDQPVDAGGHDTQALRRRVRVLLIALTTVTVLLVATLSVAGGLWLAERRPPAQTSPEVGFARDMYTHHAQAVTMSMLLRNRTDEPLNTLTVEIVTNQAEQQGFFLSWLSAHGVRGADDTWQSMKWMEGAAHGHASEPSATGSHPDDSHDGEAPSMPGMASDAELTQLAKLRGRPQEVLFLKLMLRHHRAGTDMARAYLERGQDPDLEELASGIITSQGAEIRIMTDLLAEREA